jgi:hypothetical protein
MALYSIRRLDRRRNLLAAPKSSFMIACAAPVDGDLTA